MEGTGALAGSSTGLERSRAGQMPTEVEALRLALIVVGLMLIVPSVAYMALLAVSLATFDHPFSEDYSEYVLTVNLIGFVRNAGTAAIGFLLVWGSWRPAVPTVRGLLYPALVVIGTYLLFIGVMGIAMPVAHLTAFDESLSLWALLLYTTVNLPEIIGGAVLVIIGAGGSPSRWNGPVVDRSGPGL